MSLPVDPIEYIFGVDPAESPVQTAERELRTAGIFNWRSVILENGSVVIRFEGELEPQTVGIMARNGFQRR